MKLRRAPILNLLVLLSLLLGAIPWQDPRTAQAAPITPSQALQAQMQPPRQQPAIAHTPATPPASPQMIGPPAPPPFQVPVPPTPSPADQLNISGVTPSASTVITATVTPVPEVAPDSQSTASQARLSQLEAQKRTAQATATQSRIYLPLVSSPNAAQVTGVKVTSLGGQVRSADGSINLEFPAGAVSKDVWVTLTQDATHPPLGAYHSLGIFFQLTAHTAAGQPVTRFAQALALNVRYPRGDIPANTIRRLFYFDTQYNIWLPVPSTDDSTKLELLSTTKHFTQFAVLAGNGPFLSSDSPNPGAGCF